jgi:NADH-quinone oxidoreductase subunit L
MFGALSAGAWSAAVLHLLAHGAFKALLFLAAGSVVHAVGGATSMESMGGLRRRLPVTFVTMTLGLGALAGVVPLAGFFTKDAIVHGAYEQAAHGNLVWPWVAWLLLASMVVTAALTVAYSLRVWLVVFFGAAPDAASVHEPPATMRVPLLVLAVPTALGGLVVAVPAVLGRDPGASASPVIEPVEMFHWSTALLMTLVALASAAVVLALYRRRGRQMWRPVVVPHPPVDRLWDVAIVRPVRRGALLARAGDRDVIDAYADGAAASTRGLGWLLRLAQNGSVQGYLMVVVVGAAAIAVAAGVLA